MTDCELQHMHHSMYCLTYVWVTVSYIICITACSGSQLMQTQHSYHAVTTTSTSRDLQRFCLLMVISRVKDICITSHQAAGMQYAPPHHGQHAQHLSKLSGYMLTTLCKAMQPGLGLQSGLRGWYRSHPLCTRQLSSPPSVWGCGKSNLKRKDRIVRDAPTHCATCSTPDFSFS